MLGFDCRQGNKITLLKFIYFFFRLCRRLPRLHLIYEIEGAVRGRARALKDCAHFDKCIGGNIALKRISTK